MILIAKPSVHPQQALDYIIGHQHGEYTEYDVKNVILYNYWKYCAGVDPGMLVAQMIHETGNLTSWWSARPRRNPAGIGVTGRVFNGNTPEEHPVGKWANNGYSWHEGNSYPDWMNAIWAHIGRVLCYRFTNTGGTTEQRWLMDQAVTDRPFPIKYRGQFKNWEDLNGRWAVPGTEYAQSIARVRNEIASL